MFRMVAAFAKPALFSAAVVASASAGWFAYNNVPGDNPTSFERLQTQGRRLLINEFGTNADTIVAVDPDDVSGSREVIATIDHAPEYGAFATLSPAGDAIAYTALPVDSERPAPDSPAIAGIVRKDGTTTVLADDIDLLIAPVWASDGSGIVVRKNTPCEVAGLDCTEYAAGSFELLLLGLDGSRTILTAWRSAAAFPIGFAPDSATFYFATLGATGTDLYSVAADGTSELLIAHLSDEVARDWRISPDGASIAYSAAESGAAPAVVARVVDLATGAISDALPADDLAAGPPSTGVARGEFNPAWSPDGSLTIAALNLDGGSQTISVGDGTSSADAPTADQMRLPLAWSPAGDALAVRTVDGATPYESGASRIELLTDEGIATVADSSDVTIVGWTE